MNESIIAKVDDLARIVRLREGELKRAFDRITKLEDEIDGAVCDSYFWENKYKTLLTAFDEVKAAADTMESRLLDMEWLYAHDSNGHCPRCSNHPQMEFIEVPGLPDYWRCDTCGWDESEIAATDELRNLA